MSCGAPHETDCSDVLDRIHEYLDHELDQVMVDKIKVHLDECSPCLAEAGIESEVKALVHRAAHSRAPEHLRARILEAIERARVHAE